MITLDAPRLPTLTAASSVDVAHCALEHLVLGIRTQTPGVLADLRLPGGRAHGCGFSTWKSRQASRARVGYYPNVFSGRTSPRWATGQRSTRGAGSAGGHSDHGGSVRSDR